MALVYKKMTKAGIKAMQPGTRLTEHGIVAEKTKAGDVIYRVAAMVDGERISRTVGKESEGVTRTQAEEMIETLRTRSREGRLDLPKGRKLAISFREGAIKYIDRLHVEGGNGIERKAKHLDGRFGGVFGSRRLDTITESDVRQYGNNRKTEGAKPGTINRELAALSHFLRAAGRWGWIGKDKVPSIVRLPEGSGRIVALSSVQADALLAAAKADQDNDLWLFILICLQTSMRHGEARRLRWEHYDANRRRFYIPEAKAGEREQPVPSSLATILEKTMTDRGVASGYVFAGGPGSRTGYRHTFRKAFQRAVIASGLDPAKVTPHTLRHTAITKLVKAGVDLPTVQRVSGHRTLAMVLRYTHVDGVHIDGAIENLGI